MFLLTFSIGCNRIAVKVDEAVKFMNVFMINQSKSSAALYSFKKSLTMEDGKKKKPNAFFHIRHGNNF